MPKTKQIARFRVGDWVRFPYGAELVAAQIIEERGPLGVGGGQIYRIRLDRFPSEADMFEITEDGVAQVFRKDDLLQYFSRGALVEVLKQNLAGGNPRPRVWLALTDDNLLIHTLDEDRGIIGGVAIPFMALQKDKVLSAKAGEVAEFLRGFGLTHQEAMNVIQSIGTAP